MADPPSFPARSPPLQGPDAGLSGGLVRNALFNVFGWAAPLALSLIAVPILVSGLGVGAYGVFSMVAVLTGYLGVVHTPAAQGGVRFIAEAFARREWPELRGAIVATLLLTTALTAVGATIMVVAAGPLVGLFKVPAELRAASTTAVRLGAIALVLNGMVQALGGVLSAVRRFEVMNLLSVLGRTLTTAAVILVVARGGGLIGAVGVQAAVAAVTMPVHLVAVAMVVRRLAPGWSTSLRAEAVRELGWFSTVLFAGTVGAVIGLQIDRGLVGVMLGAAAIGYYSIPVRLTDSGLGLMSSLAQVLYPLSSEARATGQLAELRRLYLQAARLLAWLGALLAAALVASSRDLLSAWVGATIGTEAWTALCLLAATLLWRGPASIAHRVCLGLGRADVTLRVSYGTLLCIGVPVLTLTPLLGINGAALGVVLGAIPINLFYDLFVQRKLLSQLEWSASLALYWKPLLVVAVGVAAAWSLPLGTGWSAVFLEMSVACAIVALGSVLLEPALLADLRAISRRVLPRRRRQAGGL